MKHEDFNFKQHGFVGHLAKPDGGSDKAVIVIMGGEQSILPGIKFAERFADYGITGLAVALFGAEGLPDSPNQIPLDMFIPAVEYLRSMKHIRQISVYGLSMGSIFAVLVAQYIGGMENLIMVSPTHKDTVDHPHIAKELPDERFDAVFSVMQGCQQRSVLPEIAKVNAPLVILVGNNPEAADIQVRGFFAYLHGLQRIFAFRERLWSDPVKIQDPLYLCGNGRCGKIVSGTGIYAKAAGDRIGRRQKTRHACGAGYRCQTQKSKVWTPRNAVRDHTADR